MISATPSHWPNNANRPVEQVSWDDIQVFLNRLNEQQADSLPVGWAYVLPTEARGSMPAGQARPRRTRGAIRLILMKPTIIGMVTGIQGQIFSKHAMSASTARTPGAFLTCTAMSGNGRRMLMVPMHRVHKPIHSMRGIRARTVSFGVVRGKYGHGLAFSLPLQQLPQHPRQRHRLPSLSPKSTACGGAQFYRESRNDLGGTGHFYHG